MFVAKMILEWISTIVEVQKTIENWDGLEGCSRRDGSVERDVILQKARLDTEGIMPCVFSVKWGYLLELTEESEVNCSGIPQGTLEKEFVTHDASDIQCEHHLTRADKTLPEAPASQ